MRIQTMRLYNEDDETDDDEEETTETPKEEEDDDGPKDIYMDGQLILPLW